MDYKYCISPEYPDCEFCEFFHKDTTDCETYDDARDAPWYCLCTKKKCVEYLKQRKKKDYSMFCTHNDEEDAYCCECIKAVFPIGCMDGEEEIEIVTDIH